VKVTTNNNQAISTLKFIFNDRGQLITSVDSAINVKSTSTYTYDANGKLISISNSATDADSSGDFSQTEVHQYIYKDGKLDKMWRIINKRSLEVRFVTMKMECYRRRNFSAVFWQILFIIIIDDRHRLTDIVRFNYKANRYCRFPV
jgi:YD repeat-containing protein